MRTKTAVIAIISVLVFRNFAFAQQISPLQQLNSDWLALDGAIISADGARHHAARSLRAVLEEQQSQRQEADNRLKWVLDNWVPKNP